METTCKNETLPPLRRVLFVDDDERLRGAFGRSLRGSGIAFDLAEHAEQGLELLTAQPYAVVVSDYTMPGMNGIEFLSRVRAEHQDAVRIIVSGQADMGAVIRAVNVVGLFRFMQKPWDPDELLATLEVGIDYYNKTVSHRMLSEVLSLRCEELRTLNDALEIRVEERTGFLLKGLINALDLRDTETHWHSKRVSLLARRLASELGIWGEDLYTIERGALLHDVGKIGVSDTILLKPGKLTPEEWTLMQRHSEHGYRILESITFLGDARTIVRQHHERWDGKGYSQGLAGEQIVIGARIFAVVDTFDAMTTDRPYRKALAVEAAQQEIRQMSGSQFDPRVVQAWLQIPESELASICGSARDR